MNSKKNFKVRFIYMKDPSKKERFKILPVDKNQDPKEVFDSWMTKHHADAGSYLIKGILPAPPEFI